MAKQYLTPPDTLRKADKRFLRELITATEEVFPKDLGLEGEANKLLSEPYTTFDGFYHWDRNSDLLRYITDLTGTYDIRSASAVLYKTLATAPEYAAPTMTPTPEQLVANRPTKEIIDELIIEGEITKQEAAELTKESNEHVRAVLAQKLKIHAQKESLKNAAVPEQRQQPPPVQTKTVEIPPAPTATVMPAISRPAEEKPLEEQFFGELYNKVVITEEQTPQPIPEEVTTTPVTTSPYIRQTPLTSTPISVPQAELSTVEKETEIEKENFQKELNRINTSIEEKQLQYKQEIIQAEELRENVQASKAEEPAKIYIKVTEKEPQAAAAAVSEEAENLHEQAQANPKSFVETASQEFQQESVLQKQAPEVSKTAADSAALTTYETLTSDFTPLQQAVIVQTVVQNQAVMEKVTPDPLFQNQIKTAAVDISNSKLAQWEVYKQLVDPNKIGVSTSLSDFSVEVSQTPVPGYKGYDLTDFVDREIITPHIESLQNQNNLADDLKGQIQTIGKGAVKQKFLQGAGKIISEKIASLPEGSTVSQIFDSNVVRAGLSYAGVTAPSAWVAVEGSWIGNLIVRSGYGRLAGFIQKATGIDLKVIEMLPSELKAGLAPQVGGFFGNIKSLIGSGIGKIKSLFATKGAETGLKVAGQMALKAGATGTVGAGAAAGTAAGPVGTIVAAIVAYLLTLIPKLVGWLQDKARENRKYILTALGLAGGALFGLATGGSLIVTSIIGGGLGYLGGSFIERGMAGIQSSAGSLITTTTSALGVIFETFLAAVGTPIAITLIAFPLVAALIIFIINSGAYVVPQSTLDSPFSNISLSGLGLEADGLCSKEKGPVGIPGPSADSPIANRAYKITYDLYRGFWCFWNRSPKGPAQYFPDDVLTYPRGYPELFDYSAYLRNPIPSSDFQGNLFWCTYLAIKSYQDNGATIPILLRSDMMWDNWTGTKILSQQANPSNIVPGSVVFFRVIGPGHPARINHVGVVYAVDRGGITVVQSNAPLKMQSLNFTAAGIGTIPLGGSTRMVTIGFGLPQ